MGMFDGRFKYRGHHDFRMNAGPITAIPKVKRPRVFDANKVSCWHSINKLFSSLEAQKEMSEEDFALLVEFMEREMSEEDYQAWLDGTLSQENFEKYWDKYFEEIGRECSYDELSTKQIDGQLGKRSIIDKFLDAFWRLMG